MEKVEIGGRIRVARSETMVFSRRCYQWCKRSIDMAAAVLALLLLSPLLLAVSVLIRLDSKGPVIFRQQRVGQNRRLFTCYKFRSMFDGADDKAHRKYFHEYANGQPARLGNERSEDAYYLVEDPRVTRVGSWLRRICLDELPQLFNVLKGDMSLVGPRPAIPYELSEYKERHWRRFEVVPGLTGIWQVKGRGIVPFDEMVSMDLEYVERCSLGLDLKLVILTIPALLGSRLRQKRG